MKDFGCHRNEGYIKEVKVYKGDKNNWFLNVIIKHEDDKGIYETEIPQVELFNGNPTVSIDKKTDYLRRSYVELRINGNTFDCIEQKDGTVFYSKCIKEKKKKMTVEEIENKLGYKIEIVSK